MGKMGKITVKPWTNRSVCVKLYYNALIMEGEQKYEQKSFFLSERRLLPIL